MAFQDHVKTTQATISIHQAIKTLIAKLDLQPHVEGGFFKETYRSNLCVGSEPKKTRALSTAIYYLLTSDDFSCWHRLSADEIWHYYGGSSVTIYQLNEAGVLS